MRFRLAVATGFAKQRNLTPKLQFTAIIVKRSVYCFCHLLHYVTCFYRASYASAVLGVIILSVCPSVTHMLC